jgi:hypothetical protein
MLVVSAAIVAAFFVAAANRVSADEIVVVRNPPSGSGCICTDNWAPVACRHADGSVAYYSNGCVAGCYGETQCVQVVIAP